MKTTHEYDKTKALSTIKIEGRQDEFEQIIDALENSRNIYVQQMAAYIRKAVGFN